MTVYEYIDLLSRADKVCEDIDEFIIDGKTKDVNVLLDGAKGVICKYRTLMYSLTKKIEIENFVK